MFASKLKNRLKRLRGLAAVRRFCRRDEGAAAVEFSLVMLPFLTLMFVIMETAVVFFAEQTLETAAADSARLIMTGQAASQSFDATAFKNAVCQRIYGLFDCTNGMYVDVSSNGSSTTFSNSVTYDAQGKPITSYQPGNPGDYVRVRLIYQWPIVVPLVQQWLVNSGGNTRQLVATIAFKNEPYAN